MYIYSYIYLTKITTTHYILSIYVELKQYTNKIPTNAYIQIKNNIYMCYLSRSSKNVRREQRLFQALTLYYISIYVMLRHKVGFSLKHPFSII